MKAYSIRNDFLIQNIYFHKNAKVTKTQNNLKDNIWYFGNKKGFLSNVSMCAKREGEKAWYYE